MAGEADSEKPEGGGEQPPAGGGGKQAGPVPYEVFQATNAKLRTVEAEVAKLSAQLKERDAWKGPKEVDDLLAAERTKGERLVLLADRAVQPAYRGYMLTRIEAEKPKDIGSFLDGLKISEPAFFGGSAQPPAGPGGSDRTPPRSNPDGGGGGAPPPGAGRQLTAEDIDRMTVEEYAKAKKDGRIAAALGAVSAPPR